MSPKSDNHSHGPPTGRHPGYDIDVDEFEATKELFDKVMALEISLFDADEVDVEQHVPFDSCRYPDGANASLYMRPPSPPLKNCIYDRKHQKKKGSHSRQTKPNKLNLLSPLPDFRLHSVHHSVKYDRKQSGADKSSAGSDHTSVHKHHPVCHLNPTSVTRQLDAMMKKKKEGCCKICVCFADEIKIKFA